MLKGISRQIVEITDTDSPYFERILLVIRSGCADCPPDSIRKEADKIVHSASAYSGLRRARRLSGWQRLGLLAAGGGLTWLLMQLPSLLT